MQGGQADRWDGIRLHTCGFIPQAPFRTETGQVNEWRSFNLPLRVSESPKKGRFDRVYP